MIHRDSTFAIDASTGALASIGTTPTAAIPGSLAVHPSGRWLYVTSAATPGNSVVQAFSIDAASGTLTPPGAPISPLNFPGSIVIDPLGAFVYFISNGIEGYSVGATGTLTKLAASPFPTISARQLAMAPSGKFLYVFSRSASTLSVFAIDRATGALTPVGTPIATGDNPRWMRGPSAMLRCRRALRWMRRPVRSLASPRRRWPPRDGDGPDAVVMCAPV